MTLLGGDKIRLNRWLAQAETVCMVRENMVSTYEGNEYHVSKIVQIFRDGSEKFART